MKDFLGSDSKFAVLLVEPKGGVGGRRRVSAACVGDGSFTSLLIAHEVWDFGADELEVVDGMGKGGKMFE